MTKCLHAEGSGYVSYVLAISCQEVVQLIVLKYDHWYHPDLQKVPARPILASPASASGTLMTLKTVHSQTIKFCSIDMALQSPQAWESAMDDFFDHAISTSSLEHNTVIPYIGSVSLDTRPGPSKNHSSDSIVSCDSGIYSLSSSIPASSPLDSPIMGQDDQLSGRMQLVWSAEDVRDSTLSRTALSYQHHESSCARCSFTDGEARKCRLDRRREQNRESQKKFRARKEAKIREAASQVAVLENYVEFLEKHNSDLEAVNANLQQQIADLDRGQHVCMFEADEATENRAQMESSELEIWESRTPSIAVSTSVQELSSAHIPDTHLAPFDHELLPPYSRLVDEH